MINTSQILTQLFSQLWWLFLILIVLGVFKAFKPYFKGKMGELAVATHVKLYLKQHYILLNDCTLADNHGGTTQIDHILLSPFGIFIIETKNYTGWIFGGERQKMWTQKIYKQNYKFQNPLHQNYKHQKVLERLLEDLVAPEYLHSVIVFMPDCEFKTAMPENVFKGARWTHYVETFKTPVISELKLKRIQRRIEKEALEKSWKTNRAHVQYLKQNKF